MAPQFLHALVFVDIAVFTGVFSAVDLLSVVFIRVPHLWQNTACGLIVDPQFEQVFLFSTFLGRTILCPHE